MDEKLETPAPTCYIRVRRPDGRECTINLLDLETALEGSEGMAAYLMPDSGQIIFQPNDGFDEFEDEEGDLSESEEALFLDPTSSHRKFRWMEEFMETEVPASLHVAFKLALKQNKPFRRFKDALSDYPQARERWFSFEAEKLRAEAIELLESFDWEILEVVDPRSAKLTPLKVDPEERVPITDEERDWILRGGWQVAARGGRTQLALLLKGSKNKALLKHNLETSAVYGKLSFLTLEEIENRIDRIIQNGDLRLELFGDLPLVLLTDQGWERVRTWAYGEEWRLAALADNRILTEMLRGWTQRRRDMQFELLEASPSPPGDAQRRVLQKWSEIAGQEVRKRIQQKLSVS
jgi:hypothetical protein